jgi:hypothetical protein
MMLRCDKEIIAKAFMAYKRELQTDIKDPDQSDLKEYNEVEIGTVDMLAEALDLDPEYFQEEE